MTIASYNWRSRVRSCHRELHVAMSSYKWWSRVISCDRELRLTVASVKSKSRDKKFVLLFINFDRELVKSQVIKWKWKISRCPLWATVLSCCHGLLDFSVHSLLNTKIRSTMLCLSGFELYSRWVPLIKMNVHEWNGILWDSLISTQRPLCFYNKNFYVPVWFKR